MEKAIEILKNAIEHEVCAGMFYQKAALITRNDESRMVFLELSQMEEGHAQRLAARFSVTGIAAQFDPVAYLNELEAEAEELLTVEENAVIQGGDMAQVLEYAIRQEERARDSYRALAGHFADPEDCGYCRELAQAEQQHLERLTRLRNSLEMDMEERPDL